MSDNELGTFLRTRREAVAPAEVGLPNGTRRRTPGLRRAELATLAGISVEYLARLVAEDAAAARHLAAARDRDLADLGVKVDANRKAINALGLQTAARFDRLEHRMERLEQKVDDGFQRVDEEFLKVDKGFIDVRGKLDQAAAGQEQIVGLLNMLIAGQGKQ